MKSKIKEKSMLKKIAAIICAMALMMSTSIPYSAWAKASDVTSITFIVDEGIDLMDHTTETYYSDGEFIANEGKTNEKVVNVEEVTAPEGKSAYKLTTAAGNFNTINSLMVGVSYKYSPKTEYPDGVNTTVSGYDETWEVFVIKVALQAKATGDVVVKIDEGDPPAIPEYDFRFVSGQYSVSEVKVDNQPIDLSNNSFKAEENKTVKFKIEPALGYQIDEVELSTEFNPLEVGDDGYYSFTATASAKITVATSNAQYTITGLKAPAGGYKLLGDNISEGKTTVDHGKNYTFTVTTPEGMTDATVSVDNEAATTTYYNGQWTISDIKSDINVTISGGVTKAYSVALPAVAQRVGYTIVNAPASVAHGGTCEFTITLDKEYNLSEPKVTATNGTVTLEGEGTVYTCKITGVTENTTVSISGIERNPFAITGLKSGTGYTVTASTAITNYTAYTKDNSYTFYVKALEGYGTPEVTIEEDGVKAVLANPSEGTYILNSIKDDITVNINGGDKKEYNVRFTNGTGYQFNKTAATIPHGDGVVDFSISLDPAYSQSATALKLIITSGNGTITNVSGLNYRITGVTADTTVAVDSSSIALNTYTISGLNSKEGSYSVEGTIVGGKAEVTHGSSYSFYIYTADGLADPKVTVSNNKTCIKNGNQYTIENIVSDLSVTIEGGLKLEYEVAFNSVDGCEFISTAETPEKIESPVTVKHGDSFEFKLRETTGYDIEDVVVQVDGKNLQRGENGVYTISNVTGNTIVSVSGVKKSVCKVTMNQVEGATITASALSVSYGEDFYFTVTVNPGYYLEKVIVDGKVLADGKVGMNTITGVKSNVEINVVVKKLTYKVAINEGAFEATYVNDTVVENTVNYGDSVSFKVTPNDYQKVTRVIVNGTEYFADNTDTYTVSNVTTDLTINVITTPVTITINYMGGKWADNQTVTYTYNGEPSIDESLLEEFVSNEKLYLFGGWEMSENALTFDKKADKTVTLNAKWVDNRQFIRDSIKLTTLHKTANSQIVIRTYIDVSKLMYNNEFQGAQIVSYGTLLARTDVNNNDIYLLKDKLLQDGQKVSGNDDGTGLMIERFKDDKNNTILNYYHTDYTFDPLQMGNVNFISFALKSYSESTIGSYRALGWIKIQIGEEIITVFSDEWDTNFTESTDPEFIKPSNPEV